MAKKKKRTVQTCTQCQKTGHNKRRCSSVPKTEKTVTVATKKPSKKKQAITKSKKEKKQQNETEIEATPTDVIDEINDTSGKEIPSVSPKKEKKQKPNFYMSLFGLVHK